jgi:hypothetical protein
MKLKKSKSTLRICILLKPEKRLNKYDGEPLYANIDHIPLIMPGPLQM